jgi:hypothetical protein
MLLRLILAAGLLVGACGSPDGPSPLDSRARAETVDGRFGLALELLRTSWSSREAIAGQAALVLLVGNGRTEIGASGAGPIAFSIVEVGGSRAMGAASTADCATHLLSATEPITTPLTKSGGWSQDDPNAAFYEAFFADPALHLPPGTWDITAVATFNDARGCEGASHDMSATVRITVTD